MKGGLCEERRKSSASNIENILLESDVEKRVILLIIVSDGEEE